MSGNRVVRADRRGPAIVSAELYAAQLTAAQVLSAAERRAAELLAAAREQGRAEIERERVAARDLGHAEGKARAARELLALIGARAQALRDADGQLRDLAVLLATKLAGSAFEAHPEHIEAVVGPLLARVRRAHRLVVRVNPADIPVLAPRVDALTRRAELEGALALEGDPAITRGGCVVECELGELDARLETRAEELARALGSELGWEPA